MSNRFSIPRSQAKNEARLRARVLEETGSESGTASIVRSVVMMRSDPSILAFDVSLESRPSRIGTVVSSAWRVRADRGAPPVLDVPETDPAAATDTAAPPQ